MFLLKQTSADALVFQSLLIRMVRIHPITTRTRKWFDKKIVVDFLSIAVFKKVLEAVGKSFRPFPFLDVFMLIVYL